MWKVRISRYAFFWDFMQLIIIIFADVSGQLTGPILWVNCEVRFDTISRNIGKKLTF